MSLCTNYSFYCLECLCVCLSVCLSVCVVVPFILGVRLVDALAGVTKEEGNAGFLRLPSAVLALTFIARRNQPSLSLVDREIPTYSGRQTCGRTSGVTKEEGHTGFLRLPSAVLALTFIARRNQPSLSLVDREVLFCVPTI